MHALVSNQRGPDPPDIGIQVTMVPSLLHALASSALLALPKGTARSEMETVDSLAVPPSKLATVVKRMIGSVNVDVHRWDCARPVGALSISGRVYGEKPLPAGRPFHLISK